MVNRSNNKGNNSNRFALSLRSLPCNWKGKACTHLGETFGHLDNETKAQSHVIQTKHMSSVEGSDLSVRNPSNGRGGLSAVLVIAGAFALSGALHTCVSFWWTHQSAQSGKPGMA